MQDNADTPTTTLTAEQQAAWNAKLSVWRLKGEYDEYLKLYAGLTGDSELIASVGLLGDLLRDLRGRCQQLESAVRHGE